MKSWEIKLKDDLLKQNIELNEKQLKQFSDYADMLIEWNQKMNLTAIDDYEGIYEKHFYDCLLPSFEFTYEGSLCDVGAGAGFPSVVLKIVYPELKVTIVEPLQKRCRFLNALIEKLELKDIEIINERAEDYVKNRRESFDIVTARAVANLNVLSELCIPLVKLGGYFVAMKGSGGREELLKAEGATKLLGCELAQVLDYSYNNNERINLIFEKVRKTHSKYPRTFAKIKKQPLRSERQ